MRGREYQALEELLETVGWYMVLLVVVGTTEGCNCGM